MCVGTTANAGKRRAKVRLLACAINTVTVLATYLEYLWASDWVDDSAVCASGSMALLEFLNCLRRYTFSDSMVRSQNLVIWACVGSLTAVAYTILEWRRVRVLREALQRQQNLSMKLAEKESEVRWALRCLRVYECAALGSFVGVLLLVPFHIDHPMMHYACAGVLFSFMFLAMASYLAMPLDFSSCSGRDGTVAIFSQRQRALSPWVSLLIALQLFAVFAGIFRVAIVWTAPVWSDLAGMLFGALEVALIIGYQGFVALFAVDDGEVLPPVVGALPPSAKATSPSSRKLVGGEQALLASQGSG